MRGSHTRLRPKSTGLPTSDVRTIVRTLEDLGFLVDHWTVDAEGNLVIVIVVPDIR